MLLKSYAAETNQGPYLQLNEDGYDFDLQNGLYFIMDGFGGGGVGDKTVSDIKENIKHFYTRIAEDPNVTMPFFYSPKYLLEGNALINAVLFSHSLVYQANSKVEFSKRGGASLVAAALAENILTIISVGNCRSYLYQKGTLQKLFVEDSFANLSAQYYPECLRTTPLSGIGLFPDLYYQVREVRVFQGDKFLFLTDGVYSHLKTSKITHELSQNQLDVKLKLNSLFKEANLCGNLDNQTAMVLEF
jgi:PPM family protein phosphatase